MQGFCADGRMKTEDPTLWKAGSSCRETLHNSGFDSQREYSAVLGKSIIQSGPIINDDIVSGKGSPCEVPSIFATEDSYVVRGAMNLDVGFMYQDLAAHLCFTSAGGNHNSGLPSKKKASTTDPVFSINGREECLRKRVF